MENGPKQPYFNWEAIRRSHEYLNLLRFGLLAILDDLDGVKINFEDIPMTSVQDVVNFVRMKGWERLVDMKELIASTDTYYQESQSEQKGGFIGFLKKSVERGDGVVSQEELDEYLKKHNKKPN